MDYKSTKKRRGIRGEGGANAARILTIKHRQRQRRTQALNATTSTRLDYRTKPVYELQRTQDIHTQKEKKTINFK